jgi:hypothetical protein
MQPPKMLDNKSNGTVYDELKANLRRGSKLSVISAYFTIYAFEALRKELEKIDKVRFKNESGRVRCIFFMPMMQEIQALTMIINNNQYFH